MEQTKQHLSYLILYDTVHKRQNMQPHHWAHLSDCMECALRFAAMLQIHLDLEDLKLTKHPQVA